MSSKSSRTPRVVARCLVAGMAVMLLQQSILPFVASPGSRKGRGQGSLNQGPQDKVFQPLMDETWTLDPQTIIDAEEVRFSEEGAEEELSPGAQRIGFGYHQGSTYQEVLDSDPYYCKWLLKQDARDRGYVEWLRSRGEIADSVASMPSEETRATFGKHRGKTFREIYEDDAVYCKWVKDVYNDFGVPGGNVQKPHDSLQKFGYWVAMQGRQAEDGEYEGALYQDVLDSHPYYSQWLLKRAESRQNFVEWLQSQDELVEMEPTGDTIVDFLGDHAGKTYDEVYWEDKQFCSWCARTSLPMNHVSEDMVKFGSWLRTSRKR